jgi:hypothetical protein
MRMQAPIQLCLPRINLRPCYAPALRPTLFKAERQAAAVCVAAAQSSGAAGEWRTALGALHLARLLGAFKAPAAAADLAQVRAAAAGAKAAGARLLVAQIDALAV